MNAPSDLNPAAIERLRRLGGGSFVAEMIRLFLSYGGEKLAEARKAQAAGDLNGVGRAVHPLKSSAGNVGAVRLQQLATDAEQHAKNRDAEAVSALLDDLEAAFESVRPLLEVEKDKSASAADPS